jgi:hypothetical protein
MQPELAARTAVAMITTSKHHSVLEDEARSPAETMAYLRGIGELMQDLESDENRLLSICYLGDIAHMLLETLARDRGVDSARMLQDIGLLLSQPQEGEAD